MFGGKECLRISDGTPAPVVLQFRIDAQGWIIRAARPGLYTSGPEGAQ